MNHLNHHIILQGHGPKRLSEEFEPNHSGKSQANRMNGGTAINQMNINPVNQMSFQTGVQ